MSEAVAQILAQVDALSMPERAELAQAILRSLEADDVGAEEAWEEELAHRIARIRGGRAVGKPAEQVFSDWRNRS